MKKIRTMSNLVADELRMALDESGIQLDEDVFEGEVSNIVEMIGESVKKACEGEDCKDCDKGEDVEESVDEAEVLESFFYVTSDSVIGDVNVAEGEYVEIEVTDDGIQATVYDTEGEIRVEAFDVTLDEVDAFTASAEEIEDDDVEDEEVVDEIASKADRKKAAKNRAKGKTAAGNKKLKGAALSKFKKTHKALWKGKAIAKRIKTFMRTKNKHLETAGAESGTCVVKEGFDIHVAEGLTLSLEEGDIVDFTDGKLSVIREGKTIFSGVQVSENFMERCFEEAVLEKKCNEEDGEEEEKVEVEVTDEPAADSEESGESEDSDDDDEEEDEDEEDVEEGAILTFKANKGYVLVKEGTELPMGNRVRARATLMSKGYTVTSEMLDNASNGKVVVL